MRDDGEENMSVVMVDTVGNSTSIENEVMVDLEAAATAPDTTTAESSADTIVNTEEATTTSPANIASITGK